jgi:hypothetical protein
MNRRAFLQSVVVGAGGMGAAGCLGSAGNPIELAAIDLVNSNGQPHSVDIVVTFDGERIVEETRELDNGERVDQVGGDLPDEEGKYEITVEPDSFEGKTFVPGEQTEADCGTLTLELLIDEVLQEFRDDC